MITFFVTGLPKPAGSKRAFVNPKTGKPIVTDDSGQKGTDWRGDVKRAACDTHKGAPLDVPLSVEFIFYFPRPKSHFGSGRNHRKLKPSAPKFPTAAIDTTKAIRGVEDALTGILYADDRLIVHQEAFKLYCTEVQPQPGVLVRIKEAL